VIADKAIVCFRCGEPTADPATLAKPARRTARRGWGDVGVATASVVGAAAFARTGHHALLSDAIAGGGAGLVVLAVVVRRLR
jgi:presenilin-like A22 family membrane protease